MSQQREKFEQLVTELVGQVERWIEPHEWVTKRYPKKFREASGELFEVPALYLQKGPARLLLDPIAFDAPCTEAIVDLYLMPAYDDEATLFFADGEWMIRYSPDGSHPDAGNGPEPIALSESTIVSILDSIAAHAVQPI